MGTEPAAPAREPELTLREILIRNERTKLSATYANGLAVAIFAVGGFAPFISTALSAVSPGTHFGPVLFVMAVCWIISGTIHWAARQALQDLRA